MHSRVHVVFNGMVQGVGFRYTAERIALRLGITGWVKNLADGAVEMVAESEKAKLEDLLAEINRYFDRYIENSDIKWLKATGEFKGFNIKF